MEDPIRVLTDDGFTNLVKAFNGDYAYSYTFDGMVGYLDHSLVNSSLFTQVTGVTEWHINTDEPAVIDYDENYNPPDYYSPDAYRASDHDPVIVGLEVCDEIAPTLEVMVEPDMLWPPNHRYLPVQANVLVTDNFDPNPTVSLVSVTSNEPDDGLGDGDTLDDIVIVDDYNFQLRAEHSGTGEGRIYTITYQATDFCGNTTVAEATVTVPHDQGKGKDNSEPEESAVDNKVDEDAIGEEEPNQEIEEAEDGDDSKDQSIEEDNDGSNSMDEDDPGEAGEDDQENGNGKGKGNK